MSEETKSAIEAVRAKFPILFNEGRFDELGKWFYVEDAIALPGGREPIRGRDAICAYFAELYENAGLRFTLDIIETQADGDNGLIVGSYIAHTKGNPDVPGVTHEAYRLQSDGSWKCVVDMWHSSVE